MHTNNEPIIISEVFDAPVLAVWSAITEVEKMRQWFFGNIESFEPIVGFKTQFNVVSQNKVFLHIWQVTEADPLHKLTVNWQYEGYLGELVVTMGLIETENQTRFKLTCAGNESFPDSVPEFTRESCTGGWEYFISKRLKNYLDFYDN